MASKQPSDTQSLIDALKVYVSNDSSETLQQVFANALQDAMHAPEARSFVKILAPFIDCHGSKYVKDIIGK